MDPITVVIAGASLALNTVMGLLGYLMRDKIVKVETALEKTQGELLHVQVNYAQKSDMNSMKEELLGRFDRLEDKLDRIK